MPGNYNALAGFGFNPYDPRRDPREATVDGRPVLATGGSSSGIGTAASFWAANVGTETSGSILSPANQNMLAGDQADGRPHQPLRRHPDHRRSGHAPARWRARSTDAAILLGALEGAAPDPNDRGHEALHAAARPRLHAVPATPTALKGARIGIPRAFFYDKVDAARRDGAARRPQRRRRRR